MPSLAFLVRRITALAFGATTSCGLAAAPCSLATKKKLSLVLEPSISVPHSVGLQRRYNARVNSAKVLHFNKDGRLLRSCKLVSISLQTLLELLLTDGYGSPKIVNDGVNAAKESQLTQETSSPWV